MSWTFSYADRYLQKVTHLGTQRQLWLGQRTGQPGDRSGRQYLSLRLYPQCVRERTWPACQLDAARHTSDDDQLPLRRCPLPGCPDWQVFNGVRYSTFAYDAERRAISTEHNGGIERFRFSYAVRSTEPVPAPVRLDPAVSVPMKSVDGANSAPEAHGSAINRARCLLTRCRWRALSV